MLSYLQAVILGIVQGVTELFPVSSLGHSVLIANLFGWHNISKQQMADSSTYVDLLSIMQLSVGFALVLFYRTEWRRIIPNLARSARSKNPNLNSDAKLGWLLLAAVVPTALVSLLFERGLRSLFATTFFAILFLSVNGFLLIRGDQRTPVAELSRPRQRKLDLAAAEVVERKSIRVVSDRLTRGRAAKIGFAQIAPLFAGISRTGIIMLMGLRSGLNHREAARFSFLLSTLIVFGAGLYKLPSVLHSSHGAPLGPILVGGIAAGFAAYLSVRYLDLYFKTRSLRPFGWYCIGLSAFMLLVSIIRGSA